MARTPEKVIITCAITGSVHTPTMSPHLPITPNEIAQEAIAAGEAGAAILHLHARDPETGKPTADPKIFDAFLPRIKQATDSVVNITSGHYFGATMEERLESVEQYAPEMCTFNMEPRHGQLPRGAGGPLSQVQVRLGARISRPAAATRTASRSPT